AFHALGRQYVHYLLRRQFERQRPPQVHGSELMYRFTLGELIEARAQRVLDVGCGMTAWPALLSNCGYHVTATDQMGMYWGGQYFNHHYHVIRDDITRTGMTGTFDAVMFLSALQHVADHEAAVAALAALVAPGGLLVLAVPYNETRYVEDVYRLPGAGYGQDMPYGCHIFSRAEVDAWCRRHNLMLRAQEYYRVFDGELWTFGEWVNPPRKVGPGELSQFSAMSFVRGDVPTSS
ncbi:MAG TPA: methyltransferase domain-containing protein, partial [Isosphaeraceae bacterium]|nr:methyltransferase domain-containing protein [Isosphaeraceae bacterium]